MTDDQILNLTEATVTQTTRLTPEQSPDEVRDIKLTIPKDMEVDAGMNIGVVVKGPQAFGGHWHERLYTITEISWDGAFQLVSLCVQRCSYIDEISGERFKGVASNFLCDRQPGDHVMISGPYGSPFILPNDPDMNLLLIAQGTGIAPFRALVKQAAESGNGWHGDIRLFYGARSGLEMLYMNDTNSDFLNLYDKSSFKAFQAVSPRPHLNDPVALDEALRTNSKLVWQMIRDPDTWVYVAGIEAMSGPLQEAFSEMAGGDEAWERRKAELKAGGRWQELLY